MTEDATTPGRAETHSPASFNPARTLVLGFVGAILAGTVLLSLPAAAQDGRPVSILDAFFTATSAVCVTGLTVVDTASTWSPFGQTVIALLIQGGGLGIMTGSLLVAALLGKRITIRDRLVVQQALGEAGTGDVARLFRGVAVTVLGIEAVGMVLLFLRWLADKPPDQAAYMAFFHSISAFNNAGFDLTGSSFAMYAGDPMVNLVVAGLVLAGSLGFLVLGDVGRWLAGLPADLDPAQRPDIRMFSVQSRLVFLVNGLLVVLCWLVVTALEWSNPATLGGLSLRSKVLAPLFHAATVRTAGFFTVDPAAMRSGSVLVTMLMMFIGGAPASTAGGIKTTTLGVLLATAAAIFAGREDVNLLQRRIAREVVNRALAVALLQSALVMATSFLLMISEDAPFVEALFEAVSAAGTVGLTLGLTPRLTVAGKLVVAATMFIGRLGPVTLIYALARRQQRKIGVRYSEAKIMVG